MKKSDEVKDFCLFISVQWVKDNPEKAYQAIMSLSKEYLNLYEKVSK